MRRAIFALALVALVGCDKNSKPAPGATAAPSGLPPSEGPAPTAPNMNPANPHTANPHAGMDMDNPHGGMDMGTAMPEPTNVDPNMVLEGTIDVAPALKDKVKPGDILFVSVKSIGPDGQPVRFPIAVDRADAATFPMPFQLSGANMMMQGTKFEGNVLVTVRVDRDGEAKTREAGDIEGTMKATIPQKDMKIVLDTPVTGQ